MTAASTSWISCRRDVSSHGCGPQLRAGARDRERHVGRHGNGGLRPVDASPPNRPSQPVSRHPFRRQRPRGLDVRGRRERVQLGYGVDGNLYNRVDPADSMSWGFTLGVFLNRNFEVEFIFDSQRTTLEASGTRTVEVDSLDVGNYHGALAYNFGSGDSSVRPYFFGGAGATSYSPLSFMGADGKAREIAGQTRLSPTFGGGVKVYRGRIGARAEVRMTPTYIKSDSTGWWCDPYWGCYATSKSQYAWQIQMTGGVTVRF